jgi:hypothetical protein
VANRTNHYEAAFEAFLRDRRVAYVAVDEKKRSMLGDGTLKSLDFLVSRAAAGSWLVDVKGRQFPGGGQYWKNWSTQDDLRSMASWEALFGPAFESLFVFAYQVVGDRAPLPADQLYCHQGLLYGFVGIRLRDYVRYARPISARWETLAMPAERFRELAEPFEEFLSDDVTLCASSLYAG